MNIKTLKMKKLFCIILFLIAVGSTSSFAQWRLVGGVDMLKSPFFEDYPTLNMGFEVNYFAARSIALTGGIETWQKPDMPFGVALGARWYPLNPLFFRMRGILSSDSDFDLGLGYTLGLSRKWFLEISSDYYVINQDFALRLAIGVRL